MIQADGKDLAKVVRIKDKGKFGLTATYEAYALGGQKLIIATIATDYVPNQNDNTTYYYRFTFLTTNQSAIFSLSKFGPEKSFARLIGESGIIINDQLDARRITELIALKGNNPTVVTEYNLVQRTRFGPVMLDDKKQVIQSTVHIGNFKDISNSPDFDSYEFSLPEGLVVAKVSFRGGNSARNIMITTFKDNQAQNVTFPEDKHHETVAYSGVDKNVLILTKIANWLSEHDYL